MLILYIICIRDCLKASHGTQCFYTIDKPDDDRDMLRTAVITAADRLHGCLLTTYSLQKDSRRLGWLSAMSVWWRYRRIFCFKITAVVKLNNEDAPGKYVGDDSETKRHVVEIVGVSFVRNCWHLRLCFGLLSVAQQWAVYITLHFVSWFELLVHKPCIHYLKLYPVLYF